MSTSDDDGQERFRAWYGLSSPVLIAAEREVIGTDYGVTGYTTLAQADELGRLLDVGPGDLLLDVGTGRGWPAIHLARSRGCRVVGADLPREGLAVAARRTRAEEMTDQAAWVNAGGESLPFRSAVFDAVVHTDALC